MEKEALAKRLDLEKDEMVLWNGRPAPFKILDKYYKPVFIRNYLIAIVVIALLIIAMFVRSADGAAINYTAMIIICVVPLVAIPLSLLPFRSFGKNCQFYLTNKNIVIYVSESQKQRFPLSSIEKFDSVPQNEGTVTIRIGKAVGVPVKKNRDLALRCLSGNAADEKEQMAVLFNLSEKDAATVLEFIKKNRVVA